MKNLPNVTRISDRVIRILGQNPGPFTLQGTNTYLIGTGKNRILLDTGEGNPDYHQILGDVLSKEGAVIDTVILSHWHRDHTGGIDNILKQYPDNKLKFYKMINKDKDLPYLDYLTEIGDQTISTEGATLVPIYTPGHTMDHLCFWLKEDLSLFSADCILGSGSAVFTNLHLYMESLKKLLELKELTSIYPGHGEVIPDGKEKIQEYIEHRQSREKQIIEFLTHEPPHKTDHGKQINNKPVYFSMDIVKTLYEGYPEKVLKAANYLIVLQLEALKDELKVNSYEFEKDEPYHIGWQWNFSV